MSAAAPVNSVPFVLTGFVGAAIIGRRPGVSLRQEGPMPDAILPNIEHRTPNTAPLAFAAPWFPLALLLILAFCLRAGAGEAPSLDVVPAPKQVHLERGAFELDQYAMVLVTREASPGTRAAARVIQLGLRERLGMDVPVVRIADESKYGARKPIWIVEPHQNHAPEKTIGEKDLKFTGEMAAEGYFIRVDAIAIVIHGATDAGSYYGAQTLLQLIRPPKPGGFLRGARGPVIPCLWLADWPSRAERTVPSEIQVPAGPDAAERFLKDAARYKLNGIGKASLPADAATLERLRYWATYCPIRFVDRAPAIGKETPLGQFASAALADGRLPDALAACGEEAWGPPDPDPEALRQRLGYGPAPQGGASPKPPTK
jgi:hypothetical protein